MVTYTDERLGVDVSRQWQQFNGELVLVDGVDNVEQAIFNRLSCIFDDMAYFYSNYGSHMRDYMGKVNVFNNWDLLANEVADCVLQDPRVSACECVVLPIDEWAVGLNIKATIFENDIFEHNLVLNKSSFQLYDSMGMPTYLLLDVGTWNLDKEDTFQVRHGEPINIYCQVMTHGYQGVPIGIVDFYMDHQFIQSVEVDELGSADWVYNIPSTYPINNVNIIAHYRGLGRFASCKNSVDLQVVDKLDTITQFRSRTLYGAAGEFMCYPTGVHDINGGNVTDGKVVYSLNFTDKHQLGTMLSISDMYKVNGDDTSCVFENAILKDEFGDAIRCGIVNFYIRNGDGFIQATKTILSNSFALEDDVRACYNARVIDDHNKKVLYGNFEWYLRRTMIDVATSVSMPDYQSMKYGAEDCVTATVTDVDGYGVSDGVIEWFIRCFRGCRPYESITSLEDTFIDVDTLEGLISAIVTDADGYKLLEGDVMFSFDDTPIDMETLDNMETTFNVSSLPLTFNLDREVADNSNLAAMIVDSDGTVIDVGNLVSETVDDNTVVNYVSSDDVDIDEETVKIEIKENNEE